MILGHITRTGCKLINGMLRSMATGVLLVNSRKNFKFIFLKQIVHHMDNWFISSLLVLQRGTWQTNGKAYIPHKAVQHSTRSIIYFNCEETVWTCGASFNIERYFFCILNFHTTSLFFKYHNCKHCRLCQYSWMFSVVFLMYVTCCWLCFIGPKSTCDKLHSICYSHVWS